MNDTGVLGIGVGTDPFDEGNVRLLKGVRKIQCCPVVFFRMVLE